MNGVALRIISVLVSANSCRVGACDAVTECCVMLRFVVPSVEARLCFHGHITCLNVSFLTPKPLKYNTLSVSYSLLGLFLL